MGTNEKVTVRRYAVYICDPCMKLQPSECHTHGCIFFLWHMDEVSVFLDQSMIRPIVAGERFECLQPDAPVIGGAFEEAGSSTKEKRQ